MKRKQLDMTQGSPGKVLLLFALPVFLGNVFQQLYNILDSVIVGRFVGADALAAVGACGSPYGVFIALNMGLATGIGIYISQLFGAKQEQRIRMAVVNALILMIISALLIILVGIILTPALLRVLGTPESIMDRAVIYMRITFLSTLGMAVYNCIAGILRAVGDSRTPLLFLILSSVLKIGLNLLFVAAIPMDVAGVALSTLAAYLICAVLVFLYARSKYSYFRFSLSEIRMNPGMQKSLLIAGMPLGLQNSTISMSGAVLQGFVNSFGATVVAANTVIVKFDNLLNMPLSSLGMALSTYTGHNIGAGKEDRVKKGYYVSWIMAAVYSVLVYFVGHSQVFGEMFVKLFVENEPEIMTYGIRGMAIFSTGVLFLSMIYNNRSVLNGAGDTAFAMVVGLVEVAGRVGFAFLFVTVMKIGPEGLWYTAIANWTLTGIVCMLRYLSGKWKLKSLV